MDTSTYHRCLVKRSFRIGSVPSPQRLQNDPSNTFPHERDTYGKAFIQTVNLWRDNQMMQNIVYHEGLAQLAADLLEAKSVPLHHDQALFKEAGGGHTPWHWINFTGRLLSPKTITALIPLVPVPVEMGPLTFAPTSHL